MMPKLSLFEFQKGIKDGVSIAKKNCAWIETK